MELSNNNVVVLQIIPDSGLFELSVLFDHKNTKWDSDVALMVYPLKENKEFWDSTDFLESLYNALKASMDYKYRTIGYTDENEYIQQWFDTFSAEKNIFQISDEFIDAWEDMQKLIENEK